MQTESINPTFLSLPDNYTFDSVLSRGPLAGIVLARDQHSNMPLAIKRFPSPAWMTQQEAEERHINMAQQVKPLLSVHNSHLAPVFEFGTLPDAFFVAREFVEGVPLSSILNSGIPLPLCEARRMASEIGGALDALDAAGLEHGRLSPSNILLREDGSYMVADAVLWRLANDFTAAGRDCHLRPRHESPTDQRALAAIVFEALMGCTPQSVESAMHAYHLPSSTRYALYRGLNERKRGYRTATEFATALAPAPNRVLFRQAWRPAVAAGLFGALATVGGNATSEARQHSEPRTQKSVPVVEKTPQEKADEAAMARIAGLSSEDRDALSLAIRRQGTAILLNPTVAELFQLTDTQITAIRHRLEEQRDRVATMVEKSADGLSTPTGTAMRDLRNKTTNDILHTLDLTQRSLWRAVANQPTSPDDPLL